MQPIVENAIYHGIRNKDGGGEITIKVTEHDDDIVFYIKDNGVGFDISKLKEGKNSDKIKLGGVGVKNVDERLKLAYGSGYGLEVESAINKGTKVVLRVGKFMKKAYNILEYK